MTAPTPSLTETTILQLQRELAAAHEELNTQAHELERLLNELAAAQERAEKAEAERDSLKRHAEAMVAHLNDGIQVDVDPEDGTQSPRSEWDFVANELVAAYRAVFPKGTP